LGSLLRIDVNKTDGKRLYAIPENNPFSHRKNARADDRKNGKLYAADVGQDETEEINLIERGRNYGWCIMEGPHCTPDVNPQCNEKRLKPSYLQLWS